MKRPKLLREWVGLECRLTYALKFGIGLTFPKGALCTVTRKTGGRCNLEIRFPTCGKCGVFFSGRTSRGSLEPVRRVSDPEQPREKRR